MGSSLSDGGAAPTTNFVSALPPGHFARRYATDGLPGGHVIMLGASDANKAAAVAALGAYPGGMQVGGGISPASAPAFIAAGASHVIVTSCVFRAGAVDYSALRALLDAVGRDRIVIDLSCRRRRKADSGADLGVAADGAGARLAGAGSAADGALRTAPAASSLPDGASGADAAATSAVKAAAATTPAVPAESAAFEYVVVTDRWQTWTDTVVDAASLAALGGYCAEFLVHGVDVEGMR